MRKMILAIRVLMGQAIVISKKDGKIALHAVGMDKDAVISSLASALRAVV